IPSYFAGAFEGLSDLSKIQLWVPDSKVSEFREDKNWSKFTIMSNNSESIDLCKHYFRPINVLIEDGKVVVTFNKQIINNTIAIYDMGGNCILKDLVTSDKYIWDTQNSAMGVYVINTGLGSIKIFLPK
ncbi:hypothetical protein, partial [Falsiporphyromonas endometrii]